jgi:hypothetical protein
MKLDAVRRLALALPEVSEAPHFHFTSFRVRGKMVATAIPSGEFTHIFVADEDIELALRLYPLFTEKVFWGGKVVAIRVILAKARASVVEELLRKAWLRKAPKKLLPKLKTARNSGR